MNLFPNLTISKILYLSGQIKHLNIFFKFTFMSTQFIDLLKEINFPSYISCLLFVSSSNWNWYFSEIRHLYIFS